MKTTKDFNKFLSELTLGIFLVSSLNPIPAIAATNSTEQKIIYPLKEISELDCRFEDFESLWSDCKQNLPILNTKDYAKYSTQNWWYNDYTRIYTVLWWSSYKYGWDVWNGWHMWVDIATSKWTPIYAIADWKVIVAKDMVALWQTVSIEHKINWKTIISNYAHMSKITAINWTYVKAGDKIWEVWSTWNSTWNHLHFQIDLKATYHPTYYDYNSCPYSYYEISEKGMCFNELEKITIDPLLFLETGWAVLNNIKTQTTYTNNVISNNSDLKIFNTTVYVWYPESDIIEVQKVFKELWYYNWDLTWNYEDIINNITQYQLDKKVIENKNSDWAWWFGPKTREQARKDYLSLKNNNSIISWETEQVISSSNTVKVSREKLLTREEIEAMEVKDFLKKYNIDFRLVDIWWNVEVWKTNTLKLEITDKRWRPFKWNMPSGMTFIVDETKVSVFPQKLYYFTDWKRDIILTWLKPWNTTLYIKVWEQTIKSFPIKVYSKQNEIWVGKWTLLWLNKIYIWEQKTGLVLFQDEAWKKLVNLEYKWNFQLKTNSDAKICIKEWNLNNIKNIYKNKCSDEDFQNYKNFTFKNTVWWLVIFDYRISWDNPKIELVNLDYNKNLSSKQLTVLNPKWLTSAYEYSKEVTRLLKEWIVNWIYKWYFQENKELKEYDALSWIRNTLISMNEDNNYYSQKKQIEQNLRDVYNLRLQASKYNTIDRTQFLELTYKYLVLNKNKINISIKYKDLDEKANQYANWIFDKNNTWKDKFWNNYFRPEIKITRWEWAYMISQAINKNNQILLTTK